MEALIAVAILGMGLSALIGLRQTTLRQVRTVAALEETHTDTRNAIAIVADVNPMQLPDGVRTISADRNVHWRSTRLTDISRNRAYPVGLGDHDIALYRMDVSVVAGAKTTARFSVERLGWAEADQASPN